MLVLCSFLMKSSGHLKHLLLVVLRMLLLLLTYYVHSLA